MNQGVPLTRTRLTSTRPKGFRNPARVTADKGQAVRILQHLLIPGNPKIATPNIENLIDSSIVKRIEDSGFFEKMSAEYGGR